MSSLLTGSTSSHRSFHIESTPLNYPQSSSFPTKIRASLNFAFWRLRSWLDNSSIKGRHYSARSSHHVSLWNTPIWKYSRVATISGLLVWSVYCAIRYFFSIAVYDNDHTRNHVAISLGTLSALAFLFFGSEVIIVYALAMQLHMDKKTRNYVHFLTYLASFLLLISAIVNIIFIFKWDRPQSREGIDHAIQGRCTWDVDAIWTGTGMSCPVNRAEPFGVWLGAGICRLLLTLVVVNFYFIAARRFPRPEEEPIPLPLEPGSQMDELMINVFPPSNRDISPGDPNIYNPRTPGSFSFTGAGQAFGRLKFTPEESESDSDEDAEVTNQRPAYIKLLTDEPDYLTSSSPKSPFGRSTSRGSVQGPRPKPHRSGSRSSSLRTNSFSVSVHSSTHPEVEESQL